MRLMALPAETVPGMESMAAATIFSTARSPMTVAPRPGERPSAAAAGSSGVTFDVTSAVAFVVAPLAASMVSASRGRRNRASRAGR